MSGRGVAETGQLRAKLETQVWRLLQYLDTRYLHNIYSISTHYLHTWPQVSRLLDQLADLDTSLGRGELEQEEWRDMRADTVS